MTSGMKIINGYREQDSDGFTYLYGKHKDGRPAASTKQTSSYSQRNDESPGQKLQHRNSRILTEDGNFIDRYDAYQLVLVNGQALSAKLNPFQWLQLFSEDLW